MVSVLSAMIFLPCASSTFAEGIASHPLRRCPPPSPEIFWQDYGSRDWKYSFRWPMPDCLDSLASANESYISSLYSHNLAKISLAKAVGIAEEGVKQYLQRK